MEKQKNSFRIIWFFFKPYKLHVLLLLTLSLLVGGLEAASVAAVYPILSTAFYSGFGEGNAILSLFRGVANLLPIEDEFIAYCVLFLLIALLAFGVKLISINFRVKFGAQLVEKNQSEIISKLIKADYQYFIDHKQGELIYNVASAPQLLSILITSVTELISQVILSISVILLLFSLSWQGTVAVLLVGLGYHYFTRYLGQRVSYHSGKGEMEAVREGNVILNEAISGIKQVKVFATGEHWIDRFVSTIKKRWHHYVKRIIWQQVPAPTLMLILYLSIGVIAILSKIIAPASFTQLVPIFGTFAFAVFRLLPIVGTMGNLTMQIMGALPNCEVVYSIRSDNITHIEDGEKELGSFKSDIKFDNVTFTYKGRLKILEGISVTFKKGKTTAIVGRSGVGKTGFVSQDTFIFNDTVRDNITFRREGYSNEQVIKAAKYAGVNSFITELPEGYDTFVGDKGMRLSAGQGQRIAVARAMIREPEILIFDEATNALDNISEVAVQKAIDDVAKDHTVIVIAHRLSTIANADKIIVLGDGRVLEEGTHEELMENRGTYWELYRSQPA